MPRSRTMGDFLDELAERYPDKEALIYKDKRYTYRDFQDEANRIAKSLIKLGLKKDDKVGSIVNNRLEWLTLAFGVNKAGCTFVPLNTFYKKREIDYAIRHCDVQVLFTIDRLLNNNYLDMLRELLPELDTAESGDGPFRGFPDLKYVVSLGEQLRGTMTWEDFLDLGADVTDEAQQKAQAVVVLKDVAYINLTSGTTSHPKAVQLEHWALIENPFLIGERLGLDESDILWVAIPVFWGLFNCNAMQAMMSHGGTMVIQEFFEPTEALRLIEQERCTTLYGMYNMVAAMMNHPDYKTRDVSSLIKGATGGHPEMLKLVAQMVPNVCNVFGLTEIYGNCHTTRGDDPLEERMKGSGKLLPGFQEKVINPETGAEVKIGEEGELLLKGRVTPGYYKDPENNALAFDADGWFHTGDIVRHDQDMNMTFVTRLKEMLKVGGINVSPSTVETYLMTHPKILDVHVIGWPDDLKDEVVMAVVELKPGQEATEEEIIGYCKGQIASYNVPAKVDFVQGSEWPAIASGKIPQRLVKEMIYKKFGIEDRL